ncbi:MAG: YciI family protein [Candidatus Sulfotelmatobacter sp.]
MKYILLMTGTRAGVDTYRAWNKNDIDTHMAGLISLVKDLRESGEYIADQGLTGPEEAKVVRGQKKGMPITDGIFPESKEFLLGYWIVDVSTPERAYAIAAQLSTMPGPGGVPTNMPIEVRQFATHPLKWS